MKSDSSSIFSSVVRELSSDGRTLHRWTLCYTLETHSEGGDPVATRGAEPSYGPLAMFYKV